MNEGKSFGCSSDVGGVQHEHWFKAGSFLGPLMLIMVMELVRSTVKMKGVLGQMLDTDNLAVLAESKWEMHEILRT